MNTQLATVDAPARGPLHQAGPGRRSGVRHGVGFWLVSVTFLAAMAFSTVPTPLYPLYQRRDHFSTFTVTIVFAVYAVGVVISLFLAGHVSDWLGRRRILIPALVLEIAAAAVFLLWPSLTGLILARLLTGLGVGMVTATATAHLHELHAASRPGAGRGRFELVATAANIGGLGVGPLVAGALAQFVAGPIRTVYLVFGAVLLLGTVAVAFTPETVAIPAERPRWRPQRISTGRGQRTRYAAAVLAAFVAFAVFGLFTSLAPGFVAGSLHHPSRMLAGSIVFLVFGTAAVVQGASTAVSPRLRLSGGLLAEAAGLIVLVAGMASTSLAWFLVGGTLAGAAAGVLFKTSVGTITELAPAAARGEALAGLFLMGYLGLVIPVISLGVATRYTTALTGLVWFAAALLVLLAGAAVLAARAASTAGRTVAGVGVAGAGVAGPGATG